jgi:hypothetical protein
VSETFVRRNCIQYSYLLRMHLDSNQGCMAKPNAALAAPPHIGTFYLLALKLVFCNSDLDKSTTHMKTLMIYLFLTGVHPTSVHLIGGCLMGVYLLGVYLTDVHLTGVHLMEIHFKSRYVSHRRASHGHVSHGRVPYRRHLHLIGVYLTGVHLMGVCLITLFRGCTASGDIAGYCLQGCGRCGSAALPTPC